ncbi:MAG: 4-hydroxyacetophenone monooxygenase [Myxococcales bacterium]|nr:4-hydroxyacetophenone monooxygenase [Myxococcales bacterium]
MTVRSASPAHTHVAIVGSGFAGLGAAIRLKQEGVEDFVIFERAADVGGVWRDNSYPGCACDVQSHLYSFSFAPNPNWTRSFSPQREIWDYLQDCARRFEILPHVRLEHAVLDARWDQPTGRWQLETSRGLFTADVLVAGAGGLSEPSIPQLPGFERFTGKSFHSARWDHDYDLKGRNVAVIGTGASAIQFVPAIQPEVAKLQVYQRTPPWIMPRNDRALGWQRVYRALPAAQWLARAGIYAYRELTHLGFTRPKLGRLIQRLAERHLERSVPDPVLRAKLTPSYAIGCKRILLSDDYLPALTRPNVEVIGDGIREIRARSIVAGDGTERPVDTIIFGTGFHVADMPIAHHVRGRAGKTLAEVWQGSPQAHLGTTVAGFPNFFMLQGPNTGLGHTSVITMIESQIEHLLGALRFMRQRGAVTVEPRPEAQAAFVARVDARMQGTVWNTGGCSSWYVDKTGRNSTLWPGMTFTFKQRIEKFRPSEYAAEFALSSPLVLRDRLEAAVGRTLMALPPRLQILLGGGRPITRDGDTLLPEIQVILATRDRLGAPKLSALSPGAARRQLRREALMHQGIPVEVGAVRDLAVDGAEGKLRARHYAPAATHAPTASDAPASTDAPAPLLVFFHGGGFVLGDLDTHDATCRILCRDGGVHVLSVDYRLAPEHPFPAPLEDARAAYRWARAHAASLGADPDRIAIGGDSAGGNLSAVVSQLCVQGGEPAPALQLLLYPAVDRIELRPSIELFQSGFFLSVEELAWFQQHYTGTVGADVADARVSPLRARDLSNLPPALVVTAAFDPLRDEGEAYADALRAAGNRVVLRRVAGQVHGFANMTGVSPASRRVLGEIATTMRAMLACHGEPVAQGEADAQHDDGFAAHHHVAPAPRRAGLR